MVIKVIVVVFFSAVSSGCFVFFSKPLPVSQPIRMDERLMGKWTGDDDHGNRYSVRFETQSNRGTTVSLLDLGYRNPLFRVTTTRASGIDYMILRLDDPSANKNYIAAKYSISGETLTV